MFRRIFNPASKFTGKLLVRNGSSKEGGRRFNKPPMESEVHSVIGIASMMRLPVQDTSTGLDVCFVGVPLDIGTSGRSGTRMGPRHIRVESTNIGLISKDTGADPFNSLQVADVGDVPLTLYNLEQACKEIREHYRKLISTGCKTLTLGGEHTITYPILQAHKEVYGSVGLIHVDAHSDTADEMCGSKLVHGTPFYRAVEEGLIDPKKVVQIGIRGTAYVPMEDSWPVEQGFRIVPAWDCHYKSLKPLMEEVRAQMGASPVYLSFDIDSLDPSIAPGTGTPEIGGLTTVQAMEIIRGCRGLNIIGGDMVEVSPPYDPTGMTSFTAASLLFEMLCILPGVKYHEAPYKKTY